MASASIRCAWRALTHFNRLEIDSNFIDVDAAKSDRAKRFWLTAVIPNEIEKRPGQSQCKMAHK